VALAPDVRRAECRRPGGWLPFVAAGAAAAVLRQIVGDVVPFDPDWPSSALNQAAEKLRAMHNRNQ